MARNDLHGPWSAIRRSPMLRMTVPLLLGIIVGALTEPTAGMACIALVVLTVPTFIMLMRSTDMTGRWRRGLLQSAWFMAFGLAWHGVRSPGNDPADVSHQIDARGTWLMRVTQVNSASENALRTDAAIISRLSEQGMVPVRGRVLLTLLLDSVGSRPMAGDLILVEGEVEPIARVPDPGGFDRRKWAASRGIRYEALGMRGAWAVLGHQRRWTDVFAGWRAEVNEWLIGSGLGPGERALVKAMVLGERDELDGEQRDAFVRSGTIHVLAVSGMHVGLIFVVITFFTQWWGKGGSARWVRGAFVLIVLWFYAALTGAAPSVLRATIMFSFFTVARTVLQRTDSLNSLFAAGMILLLIEPAMILQASFLLSFLAVLGILLFQRPLEGLWVPRQKWLRRTWSLAVLSVSAQSLTTPLSLYLFKAFPLWFLPANLVVVVAAGFAVYGGVALILLHAVPYVNTALVWALTLLLRVIDRATSFFASLPGAYPALRIEVADMLLLYLLILSLDAWWRWRWGGARFTAFLCASALMLIWSVRAHEARERSLFVVYDQPRGFVAGMLNGHELTLVSSADSLLATDGVIEKIRRHQRQARIEQVNPAGTDYSTGSVAVFGSTCMAAGRWRSAAFDILLVDDLRDLPEPGRCDAIVLHGLRWADESRLRPLAHSGVPIVLAADIAWGARERIARWAHENDVTVHDIRRQGAFLLEK